jgi:hypothetical protein
MDTVEIPNTFPLSMPEIPNVFPRSTEVNSNTFPLSTEYIISIITKLKKCAHIEDKQNAYKILNKIIYKDDEINSNIQNLMVTNGIYNFVNKIIYNNIYDNLNTDTCDDLCLLGLNLILLVTIKNNKSKSELCNTGVINSIILLLKIKPQYKFKIALWIGDIVCCYDHTSDIYNVKNYITAVQTSLDNINTESDNLITYHNDGKIDYRNKYILYNYSHILNCQDNWEQPLNDNIITKLIDIINYDITKFDKKTEEYKCYIEYKTYSITTLTIFCYYNEHAIYILSKNILSSIYKLLYIDDEKCKLQTIRALATLAYSNNNIYIRNNTNSNNFDIIDYINKLLHNTDSKIINDTVQIIMALLCNKININLLINTKTMNLLQYVAIKNKNDDSLQEKINYVNIKARNYFI